MRLAGQGKAGAGDRGFAMAGLLVGLGVMAVLMTVALPQWSHQARREKEIELIWRGEQYARAVELFQRRFANAYPPSIDVLVEQRFLRQKYKDPITDEDFQPIFMGQAMPGVPQAPGGMPASGARPPATGQQPLGQTRVGTTGATGPIVGVTSTSTATSIRQYNGRDKYNEWAFVYTPVTNQPGMPGQGGAPGMPQLQPGQRPPGQGGFQPTGPGGRPPGGPGAQPPAGGMRPPVMLPPTQPGAPRRSGG